MAFRLLRIFPEKPITYVIWKNLKLIFFCRDEQWKSINDIEGNTYKEKRTNALKKIMITQIESYFT